MENSQQNHLTSLQQIQLLPDQNPTLISPTPQANGSNTQPAKKTKNPTPRSSSHVQAGHPINVDNFQILLSYVMGYSPRYNPSNPNLQLAHLQTVLSDASIALTHVTTKLNALNEEQRHRRSCFKPLAPLATRIMAELKSCGASEMTVGSAKFYNRKIQGKRAVAIVEGDDQKHHKATQLSFVNRIQHFAGLITLCSQEPLYNPSETTLSIASLNDLRRQMQAANKKVAQAIANWSNMRNHRDGILYTKPTGLVSLALATKQYVKAVFGATSPEYRQIKGIPFRYYR